MFSTVRHCEGNIKRYRDSKMMERWLATVFYHAEKNFKKGEGRAYIMQVIENIEKEQEKENIHLGVKKGA